MDVADPFPARREWKWEGGAAECASVLEAGTLGSAIVPCQWHIDFGKPFGTVKWQTAGRFLSV